MARATRRPGHGLRVVHLGGSGLYEGGSNRCPRCPGGSALAGQGAIVHSPTLRLKPSGVFGTWVEATPGYTLELQFVVATPVRFPLPALPELRGLAVAVQGLTRTTTLASLFFGTPATFVLR